MFINDEIYGMMHKISHRSFVLAMMYVKEEDIHPRQVPLLMILSKESGLTQRELAKRMGVQPSTMNVSITRMEKNGFVKREQDSKDQRRSLISITKKGEDCFGRIKKRLEDQNERLSANFSEEEIDQLKGLLGKYLDSLEKQFESEDKSKIEEVNKEFGRRHHV